MAKQNASDNETYCNEDPIGQYCSKELKSKKKITEQLLTLMAFTLVLIIIPTPADMHWPDQ